MDTTPEPQTRSNKPDKLESTPQSLGSAVRGKDPAVTSLQVKVVKSWVEKDIEKTQHCEVDAMLKSFILDCMVDPSTSTIEGACPLFNTCLNRVLEEFCNNPGIRHHLEAYSKASKESELYENFVNAANYALDLLQHLKIEGIRGPSEPLAFQIYGKEIKQQYLGTSSVRKPDVILVPANSNDHGTEATAKQSKKKSNWRDVRAAIEFKFTRTAMASPLEQYTKTDYVQPGETRKFLTWKPHHDDSTAKLPATRSQQQPEFPGDNDKNEGPQKRKRSAVEGQLKSGQWSGKDSGSSSKRPRTEPSEFNLTTAAQTGLYGSEMFASHAGRQHVICLTIIGDHLYIWRYDRQNAIECSALRFIEDLPRLLVLLFALQRFEDQHWGLNPTIDPTFGKLSTNPVIFKDESGNEVDITLDLSSDKRSGHFGLIGRATNVFPATSNMLASHDGLVAKLFWSEVSRTSEPEILGKVHEIAKKETDVENHVPVMVFNYTFPTSSTATIRSHLNLRQGGARCLILILFERLKKITDLSGDPFLETWWQIVKCHHALWKNGIHHRDISASNLMFKQGLDGKPVGVLNDFDLATIEGQGPTGNERTGTIPFMALLLLTSKGQAGKIKHAYAHDAESFIWVLLWICARYDEGQLRQDAPFDEWLGVDAEICWVRKNGYLSLRDGVKCGKGHEKNWLFVQKCLEALYEQQPLHPSADFLGTCEEPYEKLLTEPYEAANEQWIKMGQSVVQ